MHILAVAAASLVGPFLKQLLGAGSEAASDAGEQAGTALGTYASKLWEWLFGQSTNKPGLTKTAAEAAQSPDDANAQQELVRRFTDVLESMEEAHVREIEALLREAEQHGGPHLMSAVTLSQNIHGERNITIGQNQGQINIGRE